VLLIVDALIGITILRALFMQKSSSGIIVENLLDENEEELEE